MGIKPPKEPMVRINPRFWRTMMGATREVISRVPWTFMLMMSRRSISEVSRKGTGMSWDLPTLLMRTAMSSIPSTAAFKGSLNEGS